MEENETNSSIDSESIENTEQLPSVINSDLMDTIRLADNIIKNKQKPKVVQPTKPVKRQIKPTPNNRNDNEIIEFIKEKIEEQIEEYSTIKEQEQPDEKMLALIKSSMIDNLDKLIELHELTVKEKKQILSHFK